MIFVKLTLESFRFAWSALTANPFRTILSLLGVTIGIFAIIAVFTLVDSLERSIKNSFSFLGANNINIQKWPYVFENNFPWWEFINRPQPTYGEFTFLEENLNNYQAISIYAIKGNVTLKHESNNKGGNNLFGVSYQHNEVFEVPVMEGRYFSVYEVEIGRNVAVIGYDIAQALFPFQEPLGQEIKIKGLKYVVIGVMEKEGKNFIGTPSNDDNCYIPYKSFSKLYYSGRQYGIESIITVKGLDQDKGLVDLEGELRGLMRSKRGLKPKQDDDFALNRPEMIANQISSVFDVISIAGWVIGSFSILVGGFGIANIMFVSVKERTSIIGIQKSLGAKNYFILFQFLFEAVFLSLIGGGAGLLLVYLLSFISLGSLELTLTITNIILGVGVSSVIGIVSGIIPAMVASRLDPVIAIRS
ncbi:MAG: ABC transporter permease [Candidatus Cyclobacteriaceae bacterium M3_2C_046]